MKQFNTSGSLVNAEEKEQASESGKPRPDFNFKAKFMLTMLNITCKSGCLWEVAAYGRNQQNK